MNKYIPVNEPLLNGNEKKYLVQCIDSGWISSGGPFIQEFEEKFAAQSGRKYGIAVCNGTAALETAVAALELRVGDEVIMPTFTIISCAAAVIRRGCIPKLVDSDPMTWNVDVSQVEEKITSRTRAIMIVHTYGLPVDIEPIFDLAKKYNLVIIEDAAEAHGQTYKNKPCGSFGQISVFSFYANKHVTTGEGGMLLTDDEKLAERCRSLRDLCFNSQQRFVHDELGFNFRMTNMQAAIGLAQLERLDEFIKKKRIMGKIYTELLSDLPGLQLPLSQTDYAENVFWVFGILLNKGVQLDASEMIERLAREGIGSRPFFWPMHEQPVFRRMSLFIKESYPVAENLARRGLYLPSGIALKENQANKVANSVKKILLETIQ